MGADETRIVALSGLIWPRRVVWNGCRWSRME